MRPPQLLVRNLGDTFFPECAIPQLSLPIFANVLLVQGAQQRSNPRRRMNSVRYVGNGNLRELFAGPQFLPKHPRYLTVFTTDSICGTTHPDSQWSQTVSLIVVGGINAAERKKVLLAKTKLSYVAWTKAIGNKSGLELVISGRHWSVRGENTMLTHKTCSFTKTASLRLN